MKLNLVGGSYQERSLPWDAQRTINLIPLTSESGSSKEVTSFIGTPGITEFIDLTDGAVRGLFPAANGRAFAVSNDRLYEVLEDGTSVDRGTLNGKAGAVTMAENGLQLAICDGVTLYIFTYATNAFQEVSDADFPGASSVTYIDTYFVVSKPDSGEYYISASLNGLSWDALDFATAEASPDSLVRVFEDGGQLWLLGAKTLEIAYNSGDTFPFTRVQGAKQETGCASADSVVSLDNSIFWVGRDKDGEGIVYKANGYTPVRVSTSHIERKIAAVDSLANLVAYSYQEDGHAYYVITGGTLDTTLVYDVATGQWHERAYLNTSGVYERHRAASHMFVFGKHLVGDRTSGKIYEQKLDIYSDDGREIRRARVFPHLYDEGARMIMSALQVDFEHGVGLTTGQGSNPKAYLRMSRDYGKTFGSAHEADIGKIGVFKPRAVWRRLGMVESATFEIYISDPVKVAITGAYLR